MPERRQEDRVKLAHPLAVWDLEADQRLGEIVDLSGQGMMIRPERAVVIGRRYRLWVDVDEDSRGGVELTASAQWQTAASSGESGRAGFSDLAIAAGQGAVLSRLLRRGDRGD